MHKIECIRNARKRASQTIRIRIRIRKPLEHEEDEDRSEMGENLQRTDRRTNKAMFYAQSCYDIGSVKATDYDKGESDGKKKNEYDGNNIRAWSFGFNKNDRHNHELRDINDGDYGLMNSNNNNNNNNTVVMNTNEDDGADVGFIPTALLQQTTKKSDSNGSTNNSTSSSSSPSPSPSQQEQEQQQRQQQVVTMIPQKSSRKFNKMPKFLTFSRFRNNDGTHTKKKKRARFMMKGKEGQMIIAFFKRSKQFLVRESSKFMNLSPFEMFVTCIGRVRKICVHCVGCAYLKCWTPTYVFEGARVIVFLLALVKARDAEDIQRALTNSAKRITKRTTKIGSSIRRRSTNGGSAKKIIKHTRNNNTNTNNFLPSLKSISHVVANAHKAVKPICVNLAVTHVQLMLVRLAVKIVAPRKKRSIEYSLRVAPVMTSYILLKHKHKLLYRDKPGKRALSWDAQHEWGAQKMSEIIADFGGFYRKVGQIAGTASQMMPRAYIERFSRTMDDNPPTPFYIIRKILETELGGPLGSHFSELSRNPCATASIAQVYFGRLLDGREVAVKVQTANYENVISDLKSLLRTTKIMKKLRLDNGMDLPTIFVAYLDVIDEEFDFTMEHKKIDYFGKVFENTPEICDKVCVPRVVASTKKILVMQRVRGAKLLTIFNRARQNQKRPRCPQQVSRTHSYYGGEGWNGVFFSIFRAWGEMMLSCGHFHSDPHPGNFILRSDGKLCILDWGQTKKVDEKERLHMCRLALRMSTEDYNGIAEEVKRHGSVLVEKPTNEALVALSYAYFDTRPSALAEMNIMDLENSPFTKNKITQNTREGFFAIRGVFLLRGMLGTCGLKMSMVETWQDISIMNLREAGEWYPGRVRRITTKFVNKAALQTQRAFNFGAGARVNAVEAYAAERKIVNSGKELTSTTTMTRFTGFSSLW